MPAYTFKGIHEEIRKKRGFDVDAYVVATLLAQGKQEWEASTEEERRIVVGGWYRAQMPGHEHDEFKYQ